MIAPGPKWILFLLIARLSTQYFPRSMIKGNVEEVINMQISKRGDKR